MTGLSESAVQRRIDAQARGATIYLHKPTRCRYLVISDDGDSCQLQGVDMRTIPVSKEALADQCMGAYSMSKGKDEAFEKAYASVVENGWENVKHMARQVWDMASATPPAAQVQGEQPEVVAYLILGRDAAGVVRQQRPTLAPFPGDMEEARQWARGLEIDSVPLMAVAQHERSVAVLKGENERLWSDRRRDAALISELRAELVTCREIAEHNAQAFGEKLKQVESMRAALSAPPAAGVPEECHCDGQQRLVGGGCPVCNLKDDIHQLAFETGATDRDSSGYWFDMSEFDTFIEKLRPMLAAAPTPPASEQQQAVVMPERDDPEMYAPDSSKYWSAVAWNACMDEWLRLNPHLQPAAPCQGGE